jgi:hypothetical protein
MHGIEALKIVVPSINLIGQGKQEIKKRQSQRGLCLSSGLLCYQVKIKPSSLVSVKG